MILTESKLKPNEKELYANKEDLEFFIEKCCQYYEYIFGFDIRYMIANDDVSTRTRLSVVGKDPFSCVYNLHVDFRDAKHHSSFDIRFKEVEGTNVPKIYDISAYYFENHTINNLPIESYCPDIDIYFDEEVNITHYSLNYRCITNEYDDNGDYSTDSNILDFEFIVYPDRIDLQIVVNYHCKDKSEDYALLSLKNLNDIDLIKLDYFLRIMNVSDTQSFSTIFEYTPSILKTVAEIKLIFNSIVHDFDKIDLDQKFLIYSMMKI